MSTPKNLSIECKHCRETNLFDQPYLYHAGFADQGFLYNDSGTLTLVWNMFDPFLREMFSENATWIRNPLNRIRFEKRLPPAPIGGRWRFKNPARCTFCSKPISHSIQHSVHYLVYPGSILADEGYQFRLREYIDPGG